MYLLFGSGSLIILIVSWRSLFNFKSHGFFRFLSWECILWLLVANYAYWFMYPFTVQQILSWIFLIGSGILVITGVIHIKRSGRSGENRSDSELYRFERTTKLVDTGIYKYIRHPLYSSLLFLTWGTYLKQPDPVLTLVAVLSTVFLFLTALADEKECIRFFGEPYREYMKRSRRFIPYIL